MNSKPTGMNSRGAMKTLDKYRDLGHVSHVPVLAAALAKTTGPVLEFGIGYGSTPLLHAMCQVQGRRLTSFDNNLQWVEEFKSLECDGHSLHWVDNWEYRPSGVRHGVAFVDFAPGELRKNLALRVKSDAQFILLHDALQDPPHGAGAYKYEEIIPYFQYHEFYQVVRPATLILSDDKPFGLSDFEQGKV